MIGHRCTDTVPVIQQQPARLAAAVGVAVEGCFLMVRALLMLPSVRLGTAAWLLALHVWLLASLQRHCTFV